MTTTATSTPPPTALVEPVPIMGSTVAILCADDRRAGALALLRRLEGRWSRFLPDSDISRVNRAGGAPVQVDPATIRLLTELALAWRRTDGDFDPTLLGPLAALGYDTSRTDPRRRTALPASIAPRGRPDEILVDTARELVALPMGTVIDPGGLGKGLAADMAVERLESAGDDGPLLVEIGGDLRVGGTPPSGGFTVDIWDPERRHPRHRIALAAGGVATSSTLLRTWRSDGVDRHHLLDPRSTLPSANGVIACTVVAGTSAWAEALTKIAFVRPIAETVGRLEAFGVDALVTADDGTEHTTSNWRGFLA
jgi:thiamine biosynthesis lipoprotein